MGSCLRGQYRYYHCRGTYPTASRGKICNAHYIKADWIESKDWEYVKGVLRDPNTLLNAVKKEIEAGKAEASNESIEQDIRTLKRKIKGYAGQERRLMGALRMEGVTPDIVLDELNQMKKERDADNKRLGGLIRAQESLAKSGDFETNLRELCERIVPDLDNCCNEDKKDAYAYLALTVTATPEGADIKGFLDPSVLMIGQSSGCLHALKAD